MSISASLGGGLQRNLQLALAIASVRPADLRDREGSHRSRARSAVRRQQSCLQASRTLALIRSQAARHALRGQQPIDGAIQFGTDFRLPPHVPFVTYDDQTVAQAARSYAYPWVSELSPRQLDYVRGRQRAAFQAARACATVSAWAADSIVEDYGVDPRRVVVVGIGASHPAPAVSRDWSVPRFLFVGKDWNRKNGEGVIRAFSELRRSHPQAALDIAGCERDSTPDGVSSHGFLDPASSAGRDRLQALYARATCFVMPSTHEPAGIAYVEAASSGIGSIATTSGGSSTLVGAGGVLVDPHDPRSLADAMRVFADPDTAQRLGALARRHSELFTWEAVARRLVGVLLDGQTAPYDLRSV